MADANSGSTPLVLGLTGPIACGKTTAGNYLLELGATTRIDADEVVHALMGPGTETTSRIAEAFGLDVLTPRGEVDRKRLGARVFENKDDLRRLEHIVHPEVRTVIRRQLLALQSSEGIVLLDAVRLLQSDLLDLCDTVWVVRCPPEIQMERLVRKRSMTRREAEGRMAAQPPFDHERVELTLWNCESKDELRHTLQAAWNQLVQRS